MNNLQLTELTEEEMMAVDGGANGVTCALAGGVFAFSLGMGNVVGAIMPGVYLWEHRDVCLSL